MTKFKITAINAVLLALVLGFAPLAAMATTQQQQVNTQEAAQENQNLITSSMDAGDNGPEVDTRYSPPGKVESNDGVALLVVECPPGEVPENAQYQLAENVGILQFNRIGLDADTMAWFMVVRNYGDEDQWVWLAADCNDVSDNSDDSDDDDNVVINNIDIKNIFKFINKNIVINKNVTIIGNSTGGNGTIVLPPPGGGNNTGGNNTGGGGTGGNTTDPGTGGNSTTGGGGTGNTTTTAAASTTSAPSTTTDTADNQTEDIVDKGGPGTGTGQLAPGQAQEQHEDRMAAEGRTDEMNANIAAEQQLQQDQQQQQQQDNTEDETSSTPPSTTPTTDDEEDNTSEENSSTEESGSNPDGGTETSPVDE
jgi:hypothetical protein